MTQLPPQPPYGTIPYFTPPLPPPNPRPTSVTVMAIVGIIFGAIGVTCMPLAMVPYFIQLGPPNPVIDAVKNDQVLFGWMIISLPIHFVLSIVLLPGSIGALSLKVWARKALMFWSIASLVMVVMGLTFNVLLMFPKLQQIQAQNPNRPGAAAATGMTAGIGGAIVGMLVPILMLYYMTRPHVKQAFANGGVINPAPPAGAI